MKEKTNSFEYKVNQVPPAAHLVILSFQHVLLMVVSLGFPILLAGQLSLSLLQTNSIIAFSMLAAGIGSIIQSVGLPYIGSKYLCPNVCGPSYYSLSLSAAWIGGLPLMRGMIIIAGLIEIALAPIVQKMKSIFPTYIVGLVVTMVGVSIIKTAVTSFFGLEFHGDAIRNSDILIGVFTLIVTVLANLWGKGFVRMYSLIIGLLAGWIVALFVQPEHWQHIIAMHETPFFALPHFGEELFNISFNWGMLIPFTVIAISGSLKSFGNLLAAQKISEPELKTVDFAPIRKGLIADGFSTALAGLLGGLAVDTSSSNIGLAGATKVVSRWISVVAGIIFIVLAFFPKFISVLSMMPHPVLGASIIFAGSFMIVTGMKETFSDEWNQHKTFVIGISFFFGLSTAFLPQLYARAPQVVQVIFTDPLPTTTVLAIILNQFFGLNRFFTRNQTK